MTPEDATLLNVANFFVVGFFLLLLIQIFGGTSHD
jgi:hypothetical protein